MLKRRTLKNSTGGGYFHLPSWPRQHMPTRVMAMATAVGITGAVVTMAIAAIMVTAVTSGDHGNKGQNKGQSTEDHGKRKNYGKPDHVDSDISCSRARSLAVNYGLVKLSGAAAGYRQKCCPRQTAPLRGSPKRPCQLL